MNQQPQETIDVLIDDFGTTFAEETGLQVKNTPSSLFRLLYDSMLLSTRISHRIAVEAAKTCTRRGWTTPQKMLDTSWRERVRALDDSRYVRYDEQTATRLEDMARRLLEQYKGDLRRLRARAGGDVEQERALLKEFKGIGDTAADIFFREVQGVWPEVYPFLDSRAVEAAQRLGLPDDARELASMTVTPERFIRLVAALVRVNIEHRYEMVKKKVSELPTAKV